MRTAKIEESLQLLRQFEVPITTIIDVGVQHATPVLLSIFPDKPHVLFEPIEEYYPYIHKNYANIKYTLIEKAVSDFDGEVNLHIAKKTRGDEVSHSWIVKAPTASTRNVPSITLDTYFANNNHDLPPFLLKIDVEGPDVPASIIQGSKDILLQTSIVIIEMTVDRFMDRALLLHNFGFDIWDIVDFCYYSECLWQADVIFVRREIKQAIDSLQPIHSKPFRSELWQKGFNLKK